jgi:predicted membrane chloride channel (bestrophin family)
MLSTVRGTSAMATGIIVTVPGVLRTKKQSRHMSTYLLKIHQKYDELCKTKSADKKECLEFLEYLRSDIRRREINEHQFKMLDDRVIEYLNKINNLR